MLTRIFWLCSLSALAGEPLHAGNPAADLDALRQEIETLRRQLETVSAQYKERLEVLEGRLARLEIPDPSVPRTTTSVPSAPQSSPPGGERALQALNPEISVTGDATARYSNDSTDPAFNRLVFDGFEMAIQHPLDPYSQAKFFVALEDGQIDLEEGYISWESLPGKLGLKAGRFHTNFGRLNRHHKHALPWVDRDLPSQTLFSPREGMLGNGVSLAWLPPKLPIAHSNEVHFEIIDSGDILAFSIKGFGDPIYIGRLLSYYDLSENAYFEWGLSAARSHWDEQEFNSSTIVGLDFSYRWEPLRQALYRSLELRSEWFYNQRENWPGGNVFGMYTSAEWQLSRRWYAGARYQFSQALANHLDHTASISPFLTFWQSEWVRLRAQYDFLDRNFDRNVSRAYLQFTWSLGPHKHEAY